MGIQDVCECADYQGVECDGGRDQTCRSSYISEVAHD